MLTFLLFSRRGTSKIETMGPWEPEAQRYAFAKGVAGGTACG
jgi:hypothetical protein